MQRKLAPGSFLVSAILFCGCSLTQEFSPPPRTATEQLLLTQAAEHALHNLTVELPKEATLHVDITGLQTDRAHINMVGKDRAVVHAASLDLLLIRDSVAADLGRMGYRIDPRDTEPEYLARVVVESFGATRAVTFFGMPPVQSVLIPFALPALTLYGVEGQKGYARVHIDYFEYQSGKFMGSSPIMIGRTYYNQYTVLFFFTWQTTDLSVPP
ncbi:MAG: hypothetical protein ACREJN_07970 [Nitrospiraceae bacterium]